MEAIRMLIEAVKNPHKAMSIVYKVRTAGEYPPPRYYGLAKVDWMREQEDWYIIPFHWFVRLGMILDNAWFHFRHQLSKHDLDIIEAYEQGKKQEKARTKDELESLRLRSRIITEHYKTIIERLESGR